jgi:hypothetical protein
MFQIAEDLTKMQLKASIDESDVGMLRPGQVATFRVDAYPNKEFTGTVSQVRLQPVVTQNVVTYTTIINVPNPNLELKPGMTANVKIEIARRENVLRIPMAALRFRPTREIFEALNLPLPPELQQRGRGQGGQRGTQNAAAGVQGETRGGQSGQNGTRGAAAFERGGGDRSTQPADRQTSLRRSEGQQAAGGQPRGERAAGGQGGRGGQSQGGERQAGQFGGRGGQGGGFQQMTPEERQKRMQERMASMTPEERARWEERMKQFGQGGGVGREGGQGAGGGRGGVTGMGGGRNRQAANADGPAQGIADRGASTIDALFGDLVFTDTPGRVWIYTVDGTTKSLKSYNIVRGIDDGTVAELITGEGLEEGTKLVTNIDTGTSTSTRTNNASPLMPGRQMGGPGGFGGGGGRGGR